jgi:putative membrane protein
MTKINPADHARIAAAIAAVETTTSGEVFCVVARKVSSYRDVALAWATAAAIVLPLCLVALGLNPSWLPGFGAGWSAAHLAASQVAIGQIISTYAVIQALVFIVAFGLCLLPPVQRLIVPRALRTARVRRAAMSQFLAHGLHVTEDRTGVLIFAAMADHAVEVIADRGIHSRVRPEVWAEAVAALAKGLKAGDVVGGFDRAITLCGAVLAEHFPPTQANPDELPNRLVEI